MEPFERIDIQELPLCVPHFRRQVEAFLGSNGLRLEEVDLYLAVLDRDGAILAGGGLYRDILKCIAVSESARSAGLSVPLISRLVAVAAQRGYSNLKVFTKPENRAVFESFGFRVLAEAPQAILLENGRGLESYCAYLRIHRKEGRCGVVVMNANPFTLGHKYLVSKVLGLVDGLYIIPVREDCSRFSYEERMAMIQSGCGDGAEVVEGSDYQISAATFPTYFLKDLSEAAETQMRLDIDLFGRHIAPSLGVRVRFVGSEPADPMTARYNALMKELLPAYDVEVVEIQRLTDPEGPVTASRLRAFLDAGRFASASALAPASTWPYLLATLAERALLLELEAPLKPGLVSPVSQGAHADMDCELMRKGIAAIRPFFPRMALAGSPEELRQLGIDTEAAMLTATGGINTHRGAIFALGLALNAAHRMHPISGREMEDVDYKDFMQNALRSIAQRIFDNTLRDSELRFTPSSHGSIVMEKYGVKGARGLALEGYQPLFRDWLPYYAIVKTDAYGLQKTLLRIMSTLDDTCVIHRVGVAQAENVKAEAEALCEDFSTARLEEMCDRFAAEGVSPGGAADMLALTIFIDSIIS